VGRTYQHTNREVLIEGDPVSVRLRRSRPRHRDSASYRPSGNGDDTAQHDLVVLHDGKDFATAARYLPDVRERTIHDAPQPD
jgi:hypothetical protein